MDDNDIKLRLMELLKEEGFASEIDVIGPQTNNKSEINSVTVLEMDEWNAEFPWDENVRNIRIHNRQLSNTAFLICASITLCLLIFGAENLFDGIKSWLWTAALMMLGWVVVHISEENKNNETVIPGPARFK